MAGVKITVDNQPILEALQRLAGAAGDTNGALLNIGEHLRASTIARILAEQAPDGTPWPRLSPAYAARKKGPGILRETGTLAQIVYQVANGTLDVGTNAVYAAIHQFGGEITRHAQSRQVAFRQADEGAYTKKDGTRVGSKQRFARRGSEGAEDRWVSYGEHKIPIPKRAFLGLSKADETAVLEILADFLEMAAQA